MRNDYRKKIFILKKFFMLCLTRQHYNNKGSKRKNFLQKQNIHYSKCLYEWCGYNKIYYNCIYKYCFYNNQTNKYENYDKKYKGLLDCDFVFISFLGKKHNQYDKRKSQFLENS